MDNSTFCTICISGVHFITEAVVDSGGRVMSFTVEHRDHMDDENAAHQFENEAEAAPFARLIGDTAQIQSVAVVVENVATPKGGTEC